LYYGFRCLPELLPVYLSMVSRSLSGGGGMFVLTDGIDLHTWCRLSDRVLV
jgi:hypothetical protein